MTETQTSPPESGRRRTRLVAANPIPYWSRDGKVDKSREVFEQAFADFSDIGFTAVKADVPEGMAAAEYAEWIGSYGLAPSLSLFNSPFDETIDITDEIERAKRFAADQVELGLDRTMISSMAIPARMAKPAVGADFSADRLALAIENCGIICQVLQSQGLRPLHHSHVGGVFETETEITRLLDTLGPDVIGFGPDTGHLCWAGIEDCFPDFLDPTARNGLGYHEVSATKRLWAEPGRGVVDFDAVVAAMPDDYDGDYMIEVDVPSVDSRYDSHKMSFDWARQALSFVTD
jgi:inosose dehydratase